MSLDSNYLSWNLDYRRGTWGLLEHSNCCGQANKWLEIMLIIEGLGDEFNFIDFRFVEVEYYYDIKVLWET
jgi:hypothetical protein